MESFTPKLPVPAPDRGRRLSDTLVEAELDHFLDCPNAEFTIRAAATLLDFIFLFILLSGTQNIFETLMGYFPYPGRAMNPSPSATQYLFRVLPDMLNYAASLSKIGVIYLYCVWSNVQFGGTPGKLLLGLRIVDINTGGPLSLARLLLREVAGKGLDLLTFGIGFLLPFARTDRRALHDLIARSVVKRIRGGP